MKRFYIILIFFALLASCAKDAKLKQYVQTINSVCPVSMGKYYSIDEVTYADGKVTLSYMVADNIINFDNVRRNEDLFRRNILIGYANNDNQDFKKMLEAVIAADAEMCLVFNENEEEGITLCFTAEELKEGTSVRTDDPVILLQTLADNAKLQTPNTIMAGLVTSDVYIQDGYYYSVYECDEDLYDVSNIRGNITMIKQGILEELDPNDSMMGELIHLLRKTHTGLAYKYVGDLSREEATVYIEPEELKL